MEHLMDCLLLAHRFKSQKGLCWFELETTAMAASFLDISSLVRISSNTGTQGFLLLASDVIFRIHRHLVYVG